MADNLVRWDPFREFVALRNEVDRLFDEAFGRRAARWAGRGDRYVYVPINAYTTKDELVITVAVPGISPDDVELTLEGDVLTIKGELPAPLGNVDYVFQEIPYGPFVRTVNINVPVQADKIEATFDRGLLTITLPKAEEVKPKTIQVKVK